MPTYDRDPIYLHPLLHDSLSGILDEIKSKLPSGHSARLISSHRTPDDQFELFKKGRAFKNGSWGIVDKAKVVTYKDGHVNLSRHNYLPCLAFDVGIFDGSGKYIQTATLYQKVMFGVYKYGFDWGGDWTNFKDTPHIEIPAGKLFKQSLARDMALQWQRYLKYGGKYSGEMDGIFGKKSRQALLAETGSEARSIDAWKQLFDKYGPLENIQI